MEEACRVFEDAAQKTVAERRHAEETLLRVKEEEAAVSLLFHIIETSSMVEAALQAVTLLQSVLLQRFSSFTKQQREEIKNHCMQLVLPSPQRKPIDAMLSSQLLTVVAILFKKGWLALTEEERKDGIQAAQHLLQHPDTTTVGIHLIGAFLGVFANTRGSSIGTSMLQYVDIRRSFEAVALLDLCTALLSYLSTAPYRQDRKLFQRALQYLSDILNWEFLDTSSYTNRTDMITSKAATTSDDGMVGAFPRSWSALLTQPQLLTILLDMTDAGCAQHDRDTLGLCLVRLANIPATYFSSKTEKEGMAVLLCRRLAQTLSHMLSHRQIIPENNHIGLPALSETAFKALDALSLEAVPHLLQEHRSFLEAHMALTTRLIEACMAEEDEPAYKEALDQALLFWVRLHSRLSLTGDAIPELHAILDIAAGRITESYIQQRLMHCQETEAEKEEEVGLDLALEESDRDLYGDHLMAVGTLARRQIKAPLDTLLKAYHDAITQYANLIQTGHSTAMPPQELLNTLHWVQMLVGYVVADAPEGESPLLPDRVQSEEEITERIQMLWQWWLETGKLMNQCFQSSSPTDNQSHLVSPVVAETWVWLAGHFGSTYFGLPAGENGDDGRAFTPWLLRVFGRTSGAFQTQFETTLMVFLELMWHHRTEITVLQSAMNTLHHFVQSARVKPSLLDCQAFAGYAGHTLGEQLNAYPAVIQPRLIHTFLSLASSAMLYDDTGSLSHRKQWFDLVANAVRQRLAVVFAASNSAMSKKGSSSLISDVSLGLGMFKAMLQATDLSLQPWTLPTIASWWQGLAPLMTHFQNHPEIARQALDVILTGLSTIELASIEEEESFLHTFLQSAFHGMLSAQSVRAVVSNENGTENDDADDPHGGTLEDNEDETGEDDGGGGGGTLSTVSKIADLSLCITRAAVRAIVSLEGPVQSTVAAPIVWQMMQQSILQACQPLHDVVLPTKTGRSHRVLLSFLSMLTVGFQSPAMRSFLTNTEESAVVDTIALLLQFGLQYAIVDVNIKSLSALGQLLLNGNQSSCGAGRPWHAALVRLIEAVLPLLLLSTSAIHLGLTSPGLIVLLGYFRLFGDDVRHVLLQCIQQHLRPDVPLPIDIDATLRKMQNAAEHLVSKQQLHGGEDRLVLTMALRQQWEDAASEDLYTIRGLLKTI